MGAPPETTKLSHLNAAIFFRFKYVFICTVYIIFFFLIAGYLVQIILCVKVTINKNKLQYKYIHF